MLHGVTEQSEFILALTGVQLGPLVGTQKPAKRSFRVVSTKEQLARDVMNTLLGRRPVPDAAAAVAAAFGEELPPVPGMLAVADKPSSADNAVDDDLVSDDELALVSLSCSFCGESSAVPHF